VCKDAPYSIVSVARLLNQGHRLTLGKQESTLLTPDQLKVPISHVRSLLYLEVAIKKFESS